MKFLTKLIFLFCFVITFQNYQFLFAQVTEQKILPADGIEGDSFGLSVATSGDYSIIGTVDSETNERGSAYIFKRDITSWIEVQELTASDAAAGDRFGYSVSISGDYVIVSSPLDDDNGSMSGSAYIFRRDDTTWIEEQKLIASDGALADHFGKSVSISGDYAIVGAPYDDDYGDWTGSAYIFKREGTSWIETQKLLASDGTGNDNFGWSVSISGDYAIIGAYLLHSSAYIFRKNGTSWIEEQKLTGNGSDFGWSVSISGDCALIGARGDNAAYIFKRDGTSWIEEQMLTASDGSPGDVFGNSVSIAGDYSIVSALGDDVHGDWTGSAYIFGRSQTDWREIQKLTASDGAANDYFGISVSISGDYALVGAPGNDDNGSSSGSAYIYSGISSIVELDLTRPNGGENFIIGSSETIIWDSYNITDVKIEYSINNGASWILIINSTPAAEGNYLWNVPNTPSVQSKIRISDSGNPNIFDISDSVFTIEYFVSVEDYFGDDLPTEYKLFQNHPNPFNPSTTIYYSIPELSFVTLRVYDVLGNEFTTLINEEKPSGNYEVEFSGTGLPSGIYFYKLQAGSFVETKKMVLLK